MENALDPTLDLLEELAAQPPHVPACHAMKPKRVSYTHADMVDFIIMNPTATGALIASRYGYTQSWVSMILTSDAFQEQLAARRQELIDPTIVATINERFRGLTARSIEVLMHKLEQPAVEASVAIRCAELGAKVQGVGGFAPPPVPNEDHLLRLAGRLSALNRPTKEVINGDFQEVPE